MKLKEVDRPDKTKGRVLWEYAQAIILAVILALFIRTFVVQAFKIPSESMLDTLKIGDHILVSKFIYGIKEPFSGSVVIPVSSPSRGDVVVFIYPEDPTKDYIKRVIGLPGDKLEIINKKVHINGKALNEPYARFADRIIIPKGVQPRDNFGPVTVPRDSFSSWATTATTATIRATGGSWISKRSGQGLCHLLVLGLGPVQRPLVQVAGSDPLIKAWTGFQARNPTPLNYNRPGPVAAGGRSCPLQGGTGDPG